MPPRRILEFLSSLVTRVTGTERRAVSDARGQTADPLDWRGTGLAPKDLANWIDANKDQVARNAAKGITAADYADPVDAEIHRFFTETLEDEWAGTAYRAWSCAMDRSSCRRCRGRDGRIIPAASAFSPAPGSVHDGCRCIEVRIDVGDPLIARRLPGVVTDYRILRRETARRKKDPFPFADFIAGSLRGNAVRRIHPMAPDLGEVIVAITGADPTASSPEYLTRKLNEL